MHPNRLHGAHPAEVHRYANGRKKDAPRVLGIIAELYKLEKSLKSRPPEERFERRERKARPLLTKLFDEIEAQQQRWLPESVYAKALTYAAAQRDAMFQYLSDGRFEIDNNLIENQMRPIALGRKNYLFAGSHEGARRAAVLYTVLGCCKLNAINPFDYLRDVFSRVHSRGVDIKQLLPHNWVRPST